MEIQRAKSFIWELLNNSHRKCRLDVVPNKNEMNIFIGENFQFSLSFHEVLEADEHQLKDIMLDVLEYALPHTM